MEMASCVDISTDEDPYTKCVCQLGRVMNEEEDGCIIPLPTTPTPRPDPSLPPAVKLATTAVLIHFSMINNFVNSKYSFNIYNLIDMLPSFAIILAQKDVDIDYCLNTCLYRLQVVLQPYSSYLLVLPSSYFCG